MVATIQWATPWHTKLWVISPNFKQKAENLINTFSTSRLWTGCRLRKSPVARGISFCMLFRARRTSRTEAILRLGSSIWSPNSGSSISPCSSCVLEITLMPSRQFQFGICRIIFQRLKYLLGMVSLCHCLQWQQCWSFIKCVRKIVGLCCDMLTSRKGIESGGFTSIALLNTVRTSFYGKKIQVQKLVNVDSV